METVPRALFVRVSLTCKGLCLFIRRLLGRRVRRTCQWSEAMRQISAFSVAFHASAAFFVVFALCPVAGTFGYVFTWHDGILLFFFIKYMFICF